jgi:hypothetical protein
MSQPSLSPRYRVPTEDISGRMLYRVYRDKTAPLAASFARRNRYDCPVNPHLPPQFGVLYFGFDLETCWMETVVRSNMGRPAGTYIGVPKDTMTNRWACEVLAAGPLVLAKFADEQLIELGDCASNVMADDYQRTREWSQLLHAHTNPGLDGIYYRSRFKSDRFCVALFARAIAPKGVTVVCARSITPATTPDVQAIMRRYSVVPI